MFTAAVSTFDTLNRSSEVPRTFEEYAMSLSPIGFWPMSDAVGSTALVDQVAGVQATLTGTQGSTYTLGSSGMILQDAKTSVAWNGGSASCPADLKWILGTGDFSIAIIQAWTSTAFETSFAVRNAASDNSGILAILTTNRVVGGDVSFESWDWSTQKASAGTGFNDGNPHLVYGQYVQATGVLSIYVDSVLKSFVTQTTSKRPTVANNFYVTLANNSGANQPYVGKQQAALLFDRILTQEELSTLYAWSLLPAPGPAPTTDPYIGNVLSLLHFNGTNGSTVFTDETGLGWTANGTAHIEALTGPFGGSCGSFPVSSGNNGISAQAKLPAFTGDFTLEAFVWADNVSNTTFIDTYPTGSTAETNVILGSYPEILNLYSNGVNHQGYTALTANTWHHVAICRKNGIVTTFLGGKAQQSYQFTGTFQNSAFALGCWTYGNATQANIKMAEFRATQSVARYLSDFNPPTGPFPNT